MKHMVQKRNNLELDIITQLLKKESHLRAIAKSLNQSHSTVFRKLNNLKENNVIDSRIEGKNKVFFLKNNIVSQNHVLQSELHKSIIFYQKYPYLSIIFEEILSTTNERLIILFGSYAKNSAKKTSDIDIYIETNDRKLKKSIENIHSKINVKIGTFDSRSPLIKEIIKNHIIIRGVELFYQRLNNEGKSNESVFKQSKSRGKIRIS